MSGHPAMQKFVLDVKTLRLAGPHSAGRLVPSVKSDDCEGPMRNERGTDRSSAQSKQDSQMTASKHP
jgi:hypothetical protein